MKNNFLRRDACATAWRFIRATWRLIRRAMLNDTEHQADSTAGPGTAYKEFHQPNGEPKLHGFRVAGKTGTAELKSSSANSPRRITWFDSYGPYESPRYAVVVMVEDG